MSFNGNSAGFNLTGNKLQLVEINVKGNDVLLENADDYSFEESFTGDAKESVFISNLQTAYDNLSLRKKPDFSSVSFSLPADYFLTFNMPVEKKLLKKEFDEHLLWEFSILFPEKDPDDFVIQTIELGADKDNSFVVCIGKNNLKKIHKFCVRNNLKLKFIDFSHLSVHNYICNLENSAEILLSVYASGADISMALIKNDEVHNIRVLKNNANSPLSSFIADKIFKAFPELENTGGQVQYYISGEQVTGSDVFELNSEFEVPFQRIDPFSKIKKSAATEYLENDENNSQYLAAASMALRFS